MTLFNNPSLPRRIRISCTLTLGGIAAVAVLIFGTNASVLAKIFVVLPLLLVAPGLVSGWFRSYSWLSIIILLYFIVAVTRVMAPAGSWLDGVFLALTVLVFFAAAFSSRWLQQWRVQQYQQQLQTENSSA